jgi:hypothetical protein
MYTTPVGVRPVAVVATLAAAWLATSCRVIRESEPTSEGPDPLAFRIENATPATADVTITISTAETTAGGESAGDVQTDGAPGQPGVEQNLPAEATVRLAAGGYSEGQLVCGQQVLVSATVGDEAPNTVQLEGSGTGTPGFDEGSVGLSGERTLLSDTHYVCGETVVIRIYDDGTGVGGSTSSVGLGQVTVYAKGEVPPVGDLPVFDADSTDGDGSADDGSGDGDSTTETGEIDLTIDNQTASGISLELQVGTGDTAADEQSQVTVIPFGIANGVLACAQQVTVRALIIEAETGEDGASPTLYQVMLTGEGTGTVGFDEATIGPGNSRLLLQGEHFGCGDTILVTILDDAIDINEEEDETARIGLGSVEVISGSP